MMKRLLWSLLVVTVAVGGGVAYFSSSARAAAPSLALAPVTRGAVVTSVSATGTLEPVDVVEVGTQVSGTIATLHADFNQAVTRGQVIATLDRAALQSQVDQAQATVIRLTAELDRAQVQLDDAQVKLRRAEQLAQRQLIAAQEVDTARSDARVAEVSVRAARAQLDQAQAALTQARVNLSHTIITSPVDGIVLSRNVEAGQTVAAGLQAPTLFVIARSLDVLQLEARVDESDIGLVKASQPVTFSVDAYPGRTFAGSVRQVRLQPTVTQNVVSYTTVIDVPNPDRLLRPGMTATLDVEVARDDDVLRVPAAALRFQPTVELLATLPAEAAQSAAGGDGPRGGHASTVWTYDNGRLVEVPVRTGLTDNVTVAILDGRLDENAQVVTGVLQTTASAQPAATKSPLTPSFPRRSGTANRGAAPSGR
jgi:HlyD family secretion protein